MAEQLTPEEISIIKELSGMPDLSAEEQTILNELKTMMPVDDTTPGPAEMPGPPPGLEERPGPLGAMWEGYKTGASMAAEGAMLPVSGIAGLAKYISESLKTGSIDKGLEAANLTMEQMQDFASNLIPAEIGQEEVGKVVQAGLSVPGVAPTLEAVGKVPEKIGDISYDTALKMGFSPETAASIGALGKTTLPAAFEILTSSVNLPMKKNLLGKLLKKVDKTDFYDEAGILKQEIKDGLKEAGIGLDEVAADLPESITTMKAAQPLAEQIKKVKGIGKGGKMARLAETFKPDIEKIKAFEQLDIDYLPQHVSNNPTASAIAENLKDVPGSIMADREKRIVKQLADKADEIIKQGGGTIEKGELATRYIKESKKVIDDLYNEADTLYKQIDKTIPGKTPVKAEKTIKMFEDLIENKYGDVEYMTPKMRSVYNSLKDESKPIYGRLATERKAIGKQLKGKDTAFRDEDSGILKKLYGAMAEDQRLSVANHGDTDLLKAYDTANTLTMQRKGIERMMTDTIGKKMSGDITKKMGSAIKELAKGDSMTFDNLLSNIPKDLGPEIRRDLVTSALNDAFLTGARSKDQLSIGGFGSYWKKLNRNPRAMKKLKVELTPETWKRLNTLAKVNDALKQTMELSVRTGRQLSTPGLFDEVNNIAKRAYGVAKEKASIIPGLGKLKDIVATPKNARSIAADELLSDRRFLNLLKQEALGKVDTATKRANINRIVENIQSFKNWKKHLKRQDLDTLSRVGALGYFMGGQREEEEPQQ